MCNVTAQVWKTYMGRNRNASTLQAMSAIYQSGGIGAFYKGLAPKMIESFSKGAVLLYSKEVLRSSLIPIFGDGGLTGSLAGAGAGVCQVSVMGPCTFLVTSAVTSTNKNESVIKKAGEVWRAQGIKGFFPGGTPLALRQASNWASRQGVTDAFRAYLQDRYKTKKLSNAQEILAGTVGGTLSVWNQPFEVARIEMQASAAAGEKVKRGMVTVMKDIIKEQGVAGLFKGVVPRIGLRHVCADGSQS